MATAPVALTVEEGIAIVRLARPPANAIDLSLVEALDATLARLTEDLPTAVVLTGAGSVFCGGIDVKVVPGYGREEQRRLIASINRLIERVYGFPRPTIAAVNGHAIGGGLVLALACDFRLATTAACKLGLTEVTAGIPFPAGPITVVRAELAPQAARTLTLAGDVFDPEAARTLGVIDALAPPAALLGAAIAKARVLAAGRAYATVKRQLRAPALAELRRLNAAADDPMLAGWLER